MSTFFLFSWSWEGWWEPGGYRIELLPKLYSPSFGGFDLFAKLLVLFFSTLSNFTLIGEKEHQPQRVRQGHQ